MRIFATNLPRELTESDVAELFAKVGAVKDVNLIRDRITGRSRGFAFITMPNPKEAEKAICNLDRMPIDNHLITVCRASEHQPLKKGGGS